MAKPEDGIVHDDPQVAAALLEAVRLGLLADTGKRQIVNGKSYIVFVRVPELKQ
jgi:hypothetical protein